MSAGNITFNLFQDKNKSVSAYQQFPVHQGVWLRQVGLELTSHTAARPAMHTEQGWRQAGTARGRHSPSRAQEGSSKITPVRNSPAWPQAQKQQAQSLWGKAPSLGLLSSPSQPSWCCNTTISPGEWLRKGRWDQKK